MFIKISSEIRNLRKGTYVILNIKPELEAPTGLPKCGIINRRRN